MQPVLIFGSREHAADFARYFGCLLWIHAGLAAVMSAAMLAIAAFFWHGSSVVLANTFLALSVAGPFITLLWLSRRAHYARMTPHWPLCAGVLYLILVVAGCYMLSRTQRLSPSSSIMLIGAASLASSIPLIALIRPRQWLKGSDLTPRKHAE